MIFERQDYQQECIANIITLLEGFDFKSQSATNESQNQSVENLKSCFAKFHAQSQIPIKTLSNKLNVDILMETGTGKTFTYLNLIFELHKIYKQNKFIIFVPRKAILESVKQNVRLTKDYFYNQYKKHLKIYTYEGSKSQSAIINHYIKNTDELSVLILTNSAIDKKDNILNKSNERLFSTKSIFEEIASLSPISIIDEPHLLKGEAFNAYFSKIGALYFRFGATFPQEKDFALSNVAYCLDSISAFRKYLVKQIRVHTISKDSQIPFLLSANGKSAKFSFIKAGIEKSATFYKDNDLGRLDSTLNGVSLTKITKDKAYLSNNTTIEKAKSYRLQENELSTLLGKAIDLHFEKEAILFAKNIKALSLFFIPNIEDFRQIEGKESPFIKNEFERLYKQKRNEILSNPNLSKDYKEYLAKDFDENGKLRVHQGYFSGDSQVAGGKKETTKENIEANDIKMILGQKEKLLSFETPLRFIFSVWALQEGWDNPNIFTLTKLANSSSDTSRHQQVGRGLRICVNSEGKRITHGYLGANDNAFFDINYLDMLVSGEELGFIEGLQKEIVDSSFVFGGDFIDGNVPRLKIYKNEYDESTKILGSIFKDLGSITTAKTEIKHIFSVDLFDTPKPLNLIKQFLKIATLPNNNDIILDFFAGSGTTAHAVMELNAEDNGNRQCILVQLDEKIDSAKSKVAYDFCKNELKSDKPMISDITAERVRRASAKIATKLTKENVDLGFKLYSLESKAKLISDEKGTLKLMTNANLNATDKALSLALQSGKTLAKPLEVVIENKLYKCEDSYFCVELGNTVLEVLSKTSDEYIYIDAYSDINLEHFLNLDARFKERLNVVY